MDKSAKTKLVVFSTFFQPFMSGAERMVKEICFGMDEKYEILLITARLDRSLAREERRPNFFIKRVGIGNKYFDKFLFIFLAPLFARAFKPKIIHAIMESYAGGALVLAKYFCPGAKRILTLQSGDLDEEHKQGNLVIRSFWKMIHLSPDIVTAISSFLAKRAERLGAKKEKIFITPNGLDFSEVIQSPNKTKQFVLCMGRLSWEKGYDFLLPAWQEVTKKYPEARLQIWGIGPEKKNILSLIDKLGINTSVSLNGVIPHSEFMKEMAKAEIFVLPSLAEGLGNVFIEAQASGAVPIGTRVGGIPDVIQDGENGLLIEPKNSGQIASAIVRLLDDTVLQNMLRSKGLETSKKFDWKIILKRIEEIYQYALHEKRK